MPPTSEWWMLPLTLAQRVFASRSCCFSWWASAVALRPSRSSPPEAARQPMASAAPAARRCSGDPASAPVAIPRKPTPASSASCPTPLPEAASGGSGSSRSRQRTLVRAAAAAALCQPRSCCASRRASESVSAEVSVLRSVPNASAERDTCGRASTLALSARGDGAHDGADPEPSAQEQQTAGAEPAPRAEGEPPAGTA